MARTKTADLPYNERRDDDVCSCGDRREQHKDFSGRCNVCSDSHAPYDGCKGFRFSRRQHLGGGTES